MTTPINTNNPKGKRRMILDVRTMTHIALLAAILVVCSQITIPFLAVFPSRSRPLPLL